MTRRKKRRTPPVLRHLQPCPDCAAELAGGEFKHEDSCPLVGAMEDVCSDDARWFLENAGERIRVRAITRAELAVLGHLDPRAAAKRPTHVHVTNYPPHGRFRGFCDDNDGMHGLMFDAAS